MPAKFTIADEVTDSRVAKVFGSNRLGIEPRYLSTIVASGTATGVIFSGAGVLHAIIFNASAAGASFWLWDNADTATAAIIGASASAMARYSGLSIGSHIYDAIVSGALYYRLSTAVADGITVVYNKGS